MLEKFPVETLRPGDVLVRLSAFILLCIGIQIIWTGCSALVGIAR